MQTHDGLYLRRTVTTLLGLAILGWAGAQPASAQATPKRTHSVSDKDPKTRDQLAQRDALDWDSNENDPTMVDPAPMSYPFAAPGSLNLNHWTDYTKRFMAPGSVQEEREARRELRDRRRRDRDQRLNSMLGNYSPSAYETGYDVNAPGGAYNRGSGYYNTAGGYQSDMGSGFAGGPMANWSPMAAFGDYIYVVRRNTLFKLNGSDMSILRQQELPAWSGTAQGSSSSYSGSTGSSANGSGIQQNGASGSSGSGSNNGSGTTGTSGSNNGSGNTGSGTSQNNNNQSGTSTGAGTSSNTGGSGQTGTSAGTNNGTNSGGNDSNNSRTSGRRRNNRRGDTYSPGSFGQTGAGASMGMGTTWPVSVAASNDFVYVMRGGVVYQLRASDLSLVSQKSLPSLTGYGDSDGSFNRWSNGSGNSGRRRGDRGSSSNDQRSGDTNNAGTSTGGSQGSNGGNGTGGGSP